ncbi:MAG: 50S ribosomal protein L21 [Alphaproteobacteria bacterium]|nr:50S ribosomal protein L21 [Alphaproteobacteria bacterium]
MFAVIQTGGKQYKVASNDTLVVEKLAGEPGDTVTFDVLAVGSEKQVAIGAPTVSGAKVTAEILSHGQGEKVIIFKKKRRQNYRRTKGHRQPYTALFINEILDDKGNKAAADAAKKPKPKAEAKPAEKKVEKKVAKKPAAKPAAKKAAPKKAAKPAAKKTETKAATKPAAKKTESKKAE